MARAVVKAADMAMAAATDGVETATPNEKAALQGGFCMSGR
jgi:hypothetical protein